MTDDLTIARLRAAAPLGGGPPPSGAPIGTLMELEPSVTVPIQLLRWVIGRCGGDGMKPSRGVLALVWVLSTVGCRGDARGAAASASSQVQASPSSSFDVDAMRGDMPDAPVEDQGECSATHPGGCKAAAKQIETTDPAKAAALYTIGCDGGSSGCCVNLGGMFSKGSVVPKDEARAAALFGRACAVGNPYGCHNLAVRLRDGTPPDPAAALRLFWRACRDLPYSCFDVALAYVEGVGTERDPEKAVEPLKEGCRGRVGKACVKLGQLLRAGTVVDGEQTFGQWFDMGCDLDDGDACAYAGVGHLADSARAAELLEKGCTLGSKAACATIGDHFSDGQLVRVDRPRAVDGYRRACKLGDAESCRRAEELGPASSVSAPPASASASP